MFRCLLPGQLPCRVSLSIVVPFPIPRTDVSPLRDSLTDRMRSPWGYRRPARDLESALAKLRIFANGSEFTVDLLDYVTRRMRRSHKRKIHLCYVGKAKLCLSINVDGVFGTHRNSLHTGEVVGSIPTAPTISINILALTFCGYAHVSPKIPSVKISDGRTGWLTTQSVSDQSPAQIPCYSLAKQRSENWQVI